MLNAILTHHLTQGNSATSQDLLRNLYVDNAVSSSHTEKGCLDYLALSLQDQC